MCIVLVNIVCSRCTCDMEHAFCKPQVSETFKTPKVLAKGNFFMFLEINNLQSYLQIMLLYIQKSTRLSRYGISRVLLPAKVCVFTGSRLHQSPEHAFCKPQVNETSKTLELQVLTQLRISVKIVIICLSLEVETR